VLCRVDHSEILEKLGDTTAFKIYYSVRTPPEFYEPSPEETAICVREMAERGYPLHPDVEALEGRNIEAVEEVLKNNSLVALRFIEALHRGDVGFIRKIADSLRDHLALKKAQDYLDGIDHNDVDVFDSGEYKKACLIISRQFSNADLDSSLLRHAIEVAARTCDGVPTVEMVAEKYEDLGLIRHQGLQYSQDPLGEVIHKASIPKREGRKKRFEKLKSDLKSIGFGWLPHRKRGDTLKRKRKVP